MLTKSSYLSFAHCPRRFWLAENYPKLATPPDPAALRRMLAGQEVDKLAREVFPDGVHIPYRPASADMAALTAEAIEAGAETLFQATIGIDDLLIRADILSRTPGGWRLIEVKSTTGVREEEHLPDLAFQIYVMEAAELEVATAEVMHLNKECRYPDLSNLFTLADVTAATRALLPAVTAATEMMRPLQEQAGLPEVPIGRHCKKPRTCPFTGFCWQDVDGPTIFDIPRLNQAIEEELRQAGALHLRDVPDDAPLSAAQRALVDRINKKLVQVNRPTIREALDDLEYPLAFFDFETIDAAVPHFEGCRPYQQVPFQYSCHVLERDGSLGHHEYLHTTTGDPRPGLVEALLANMGDSGHIVVYYAPFERGVLEALAAAFPQHAARLEGMIERLWDQLVIFRKHYDHHAFGVSKSLKSVQPVVAPHLSYGALEVQDGTQAQVVWEEMIATQDVAEKENLVGQLLDYCRLDTLAMVEIHHALTAL